MTAPTLRISAPVRISFGIMLALLFLIGWLHLATLVLTALFGYLSIRGLNGVVGGRKWLAVSLYTILVSGLILGLVYFSKQAYVTLPKLANSTIPAVVEFAEKRGLELPFTDFASLKKVAVEEVRVKFANVGLYVRGAMFEIASFIVGLVLPVSLFLNSRFQMEGDPHAVQGSLYSLVSRELGRRFRTFYESFSTVIGAQIVISAINTGVTATFLVWADYQYVPVILTLTFLCGLLPIVGNLLSNTLIIGVGFTISPQTALWALIFLVTIHKLEYFLNSKIIGDRIKNPMWLTLIGLVVGERLMGIPGMIFAPVVLHYLKVETSKARVAANSIGLEDEPEV
ncbi:MAG TPA: AI-2E family transporter [Verrucomicrobiota bacterium]|nr:hypothetical protein [Verrucomicrobiales bacterium]HRI13443.1 AI-2E family transporter [Verrucomicrobiota bacterium]